MDVRCPSIEWTASRYAWCLPLGDSLGRGLNVGFRLSPMAATGRFANFETASLIGQLPTVGAQPKSFWSGL